MLGNSSLTDWLLMVPALLISLTIHELSHGLMAYMLGDNTAKREGRLTLNPIKHIDLLGLIMLFTVHFGWAKPVPVDPRYFKNAKRGMAITALAGPFANILVAFLSALILVLIGAISIRGGNVYAASRSILALFLMKLFAYNCSFAIFNLLPIPPLDGSKIVGAFLPDRTYYKYLQYEAYGMIIMVIVLSTNILTPVLQNGVNNLTKLIFGAIKLLGL